MARLPGPAEFLPVPGAGAGIPRMGPNPKDAVISGIGRQAVALENELYAEFEKEAERVAEVQATDLNNKYMAFLVDQRDGEDGFRQYKAGDAVNKPLLKDYTKKIQDWYDQNTKGLDPRVIEKFKPQYEYRKTAFSQDIMQHQVREKEVYDANVAAGQIASAETEAYAQYQNEDRVRAELVPGFAAIRKQAERLGMTGKEAEDYIAMENKKLSSSVWGAVIGRNIDEGNIARARTMLKNHEKEIDPRTVNTLSAAMKEGDTRLRSQSAADRIYDECGGDFDCMRNKAREQPSEIRDSVLSRVKARAAEDHASLAKAQDDEYQFAKKLVTNYSMGKLPVSKDIIPPSTWTAMNGDQQAAIAGMIANANKPDPERDNRSRYQELLAMATSPDPYTRAQFASDQIDLAVEPLSTAHFNELTKLRQSIVEGTTEVDQIATKEQMLKSAMSQAGLDWKKYLEGDEEEVQFYNYAQSQLNALGKDWTPSDLKKILDGMVINVIEKRVGLGVDVLWPDKETPAYLMQIEGVPDILIPGLARAVKAADQEVTPENIRKLYEYRMSR